MALSPSENTVTSDKNLALEKAAYWHTRMQSSDVSIQEQLSFDQWYAISSNADLYQRIDAMWSQIDSLGPEIASHTVHNVLKDQDTQAVQRSRRVKATGFCVGLVFICGILATQIMSQGQFLQEHIFSGRLLADYKSAKGESSTIILQDKTRLQLNTFTSVDIDYTPQQRTIYLLQGEIQLDVAPDKQRPLVVISSNASTHALGTEFIVRDLRESTHISVTESKVEVCAAVSEQCHIVQAGESVIAGAGKVSVPQPIDPGFVYHWNKKLLIVDNQPVVKVLDEFRRHNRGYMHIDREALQAFRVSGVFALDDLVKSLQVIEATIPIKVTRYTRLLTLIEKK